MTKKLTDAQFVNALSSSQARLRAYAISMVKSPSDADDLLQNACLALWEKRHEFDSDRDFFPWACGFVRIQILRHIRKKSKAKLLFDETLINTLSAEYIAGYEQYDNRRQHLHECLEKLAAKDRGLLDDRYGKKVMPKEISFLRSWPLQTVYSTLSRIRLQLRRCIESNMAQQASPDVGRLD